MTIPPAYLVIVALAVGALLVWAMAMVAAGRRSSDAPEVRRCELAQRARFDALRRELASPNGVDDDYVAFWCEVLDGLVDGCGAYAETALAVAKYLTRHREPPGPRRRIVASPQLADFDDRLTATLDEFWLTHLGVLWMDRLRPLAELWEPPTGSSDEADPAAVEVVRAGFLNLPAELLRHVIGTVADRLAQGELPGGDAWQAQPPLYQMPSRRSTPPGRD